MANGKQLSETNFATFQAWAQSKTDADFREMANRGVLARKEIAIECGFAKSVLDQNPRVKAALRELEDGLRSRGILPPAALPEPGSPPKPLVRQPGQVRAALDAERVRRLEQENAGLKAELAEVKRLLEKFTLLQDALTHTGRLPR